MPKKVFFLTIVQSILAIGLPVIFINFYVLDANNLLFFVGVSFSISTIISFLIKEIILVLKLQILFKQI